MSKWKLYASKPPFDGVYEVRAQGSSIISIYSVKDGVITDKDGDEVLNFSCEWRYLRAVN
ncbi:hypothetical protein [Pseudoalteromonas phenolica]|uniref:hypothetical protein n=1 Tax=Pseudoalteromonas phenolica TaxID=161398 RepID=UPI00384FDEAA